MEEDKKEEDKEEIKQIDEDLEESPEEKNQKKKKDSIMIYAFIIIILGLALIIILPRFFTPKIITLDELHKLNMEGKLPPDEGYMYNGLYSFVFYEGLWHTQLAARNGDNVNQYDMHFHYGPREVEDIPSVGYLNTSNLNSYKNFFMTFDPTDDDLSYIAASTSETNFIIIQVFGKGVIASCVNNQSSACIGRPIVECNSTDAPVFYFASEENTSLVYLNNCAIIAGKKEELLRATDRMIYDLLGLIE